MTAERIPCDNCGVPTHHSQIDAKPFANATPEQIAAALDDGIDFTRFECRTCYGPGWAPLYDGFPA